MDPIRVQPTPGDNTAAVQAAINEALALAAHRISDGPSPQPNVRFKGSKDT